MENQINSNSNTKFSILVEAYKLFLINNIEKVTIQELERAIGKTRGSIFYYFANKQTLFEAVVEQIFLPSFSFPAELIESVYTQSLESFIEAYKSPEERVINQLRETYKTEDPEIAYYNFIFQVNKYYPNFKERFCEVLKMDYVIWNIVIKTAQEKNELKKINPEDLSKLFFSISSGITFNSGYLSTFSFDCKAIYLLLYQILRK